MSHRAWPDRSHCRRVQRGMECTQLHSEKRMCRPYKRDTSRARKSTCAFQTDMRRTGFGWLSLRAAQLHSRYMMSVPRHPGTGQLRTQSKLRLTCCHRTDQLGRTDTLSPPVSTHNQRCSPHTQSPGPRHDRLSSQHTAYTSQTVLENTNLLRTACTQYSDQSPGLPVRSHSRYTSQHWHAMPGLHCTIHTELRSHDQCQLDQRRTSHRSPCCQEHIYPAHNSCTWLKDQSHRRHCRGRSLYMWYYRMHCILLLGIQDSL